MRIEHIAWVLPLMPAAAMDLHLRGRRRTHLGTALHRAAEQDPGILLTRQLHRCLPEPDASGDALQGTPVATASHSVQVLQ